MHVYEGKRIGNETVVTVNGQTLCPRLDLINHASTGFEWSRSGGGSAQLALAILAYHCGSDEMRALLNYPFFRDQVIVALNETEWRLDSKAVEYYLAVIETAVAA